MSNQYPKWKYHADHAAIIVGSEEEEKNLGRGWNDEPVPGADLPAAPASPEEFAKLTGDEAFDNFLIDNGMDKVTAPVQAMIRKAYDHQAAPAAASVEQSEAEKEEARKALLQKAKDLGVTVHHASGISTIQAAIDAHVAKE